MINRIDKKFSDLKKAKKKALVVFLTAGDPSLARTEALILEFERAGVDLIEIGVPFSDPLADGPVIQASSMRALSRGVNLKKILAMTRRVRKRTSIPLLFMSYLNPIAHYGEARFAKEAKACGLDGVIIPDLPPEEGRDIAHTFRRHGLDLVYLLAPTSTARRQRLITQASRGFVYFVSMTGVTGVKHALSGAVLKQVERLRKVSTRPICIGFGISTPDQARAAARAGDGVIVGSAIVKALHENPSLSPAAFVRRFISPIAQALGKRRT